ncbi:nucleotide-binding protein [Bradyrhizobium sp. BRP14]|nr:nucleotide-binding protein [Bradyrhizobium sp. BRP14]
MVRRTPPSLPVEPRLSAGQIRRCIERFNRCIADLEAFDPSKIQKRYPRQPEVIALEAAIDEALATAFGEGTPTYIRYSGAKSLDQGPHVMRVGSAFGRGPRVDHEREEAIKARQYLAEGKERSIVLLKQAVRALEDQLSDHEAEIEETSPTLDRSFVNSKVFIVHGHDDAALQGLARFLEKIGLEAIILKEQPNQGRSIIEKFEDCAKEVGFAVILLTPDDVGSSVAEPEHNRRARQNVIFELGYFAGKLGRGRVCLLRKGEIEIPSDLYGVIYTDMDPAEGWKMGLVKELKAAKIEFDANKVWDS